MEKLPPFEKIYEAWTAIADNRVELQEDQAVVASSNGKKLYMVHFGEAGYSSNDNATYWQRYAGYPILAVMMLQGKLPLNREAAAHFSGVQWNELNQKHKRNYAAAAEEVLEALAARGVETRPVVDAAVEVYAALRELDIPVRRSPVSPPK